MSALVRNGPARWLLCRACRQKHGVPAPGWAASVPGTEAPGRRPYATVINPKNRPSKASQPRPPKRTPSPSLSGQPKLWARSGPGANSEPARPIFSLRDVPALPEWVSSLENLGNGDLTATQCIEGARLYVSVATQHESLWRDKLEKEHNLSPYLLHWIGILLLSGNTASRWRLGTHMLRSASELGYTPSTLTLVRIFRSMPTTTFEAQAARSTLFVAADARFRDILRQGTNPDALTLQGLILAKRGDQKKALTMFRHATQAWEKTNQGKAGVGAGAGAVGGNGSSGRETQAPAVASSHVTDKSPNGGGAVGGAAGKDDFILPPPREPRWEWEVSCVLGQADALRSQGDTRGAEELYRVAALELDNPRAFFQLARLMGGPRDSPERRTFLLKAAISGEPEACRELGKLEGMAAAKKGLPGKEKAEHDMLSKEWFRLASGEDLAAIKAEDVGASEGQ